MNTVSPRYDGKPLLRLLELYVLNVIGEISSEDADRMTAMTPKLSQIFGYCGGWPEIIASAAGLPQEVSLDIRNMWESNQEVASANGLILSPQQFAEMFVDDNFG